MNPVRAGMVRDPADHIWSGHRAYLGLQNIPWLTTDFVLSMFAHEAGRAREAYARFVRDGVGQPISTDLVQGHPDDARVLGSDRFLQSLPANLPKRCLLTIEQIAQRVCSPYGIDPAQLACASRTRELSLLRSLVVHSALHLRAASLSDLARYFNRSASALSQTLEHNRRHHPALFVDGFDTQFDRIP